jgi:hypothetical protein
MDKKSKKPVKRKRNSLTPRDCLTILSELSGIAGFLLALYIFIKEYL